MMSAPDDVIAVRGTLGPHFQLYAAGPGEPVNWRLLSGNNRDLGRGQAACETAEECRTALSELLSELSDCQGVVRPGAPNRWMWALRLRGVVVAVSGHDYDRQIRCERARSQFMVYAPTAPVDAVVMFTSARRSSRAAREPQTAVPSRQPSGRLARADRVVEIRRLGPRDMVSHGDMLAHGDMVTHGDMVAHA
ncbi:MAG: hypothetical protein QOE89_3298, partial [Pseudonocardiales bacterium]|nr:hypothetical protein [Pseudonocardiales bacterium]